MHEQPLSFSGQLSVLFPRMAPLSQFVALLIDGDNIQLTEEQLIRVLQEAGSLGEVAVRRVYGNWSATAKSAWKELVLRYALKPCHHISGLDPEKSGR
jgi:NYN domain